MDIVLEALNRLGQAMADSIDADITYGLDDRCLKWCKARMLSEIRAIKPYPRSKRQLLKLLRDK